MRVDSASLISGAVVCGDRGLGVLGSVIPATGDNGPGYAYNDLILPADANKEICGRITSWPTNGTLIAYEDTSFTYTGTSDSFSYQLYVDGVATGVPTSVSLTIGGATASAAITTDGVVVSGGAIGSVATIPAGQLSFEPVNNRYAFNPSTDAFGFTPSSDRITFGVTQ